MAPEDRERWILVALPAIAIGTLYVLFFYVSDNNALQAMQNSYDEAKKREVPMIEMAKVSKKLDDIKIEVADLEALQKKLQTKWSEIAKRANQQTSRVDHVNELTEMLNKRNLRIVEAGEAEQGNRQELPPALVKARERLKREGSEIDLVVWQVKCVGKYREVAEVLEELAASPHGPIPISIQMDQAAPLAEERVWVIGLAL